MPNSNFKLDELEKCSDFWFQSLEWMEGLQCFELLYKSEGQSFGSLAVPCSSCRLFSKQDRSNAGNRVPPLYSQQCVQLLEKGFGWSGSFWLSLVPSHQGGCGSSSVSWKSRITFLKKVSSCHHHSNNRSTARVTLMTPFAFQVLRRSTGAMAMEAVSWFWEHAFSDLSVYIQNLGSAQTRKRTCNVFS